MCFQTGLILIWGNLAKYKIPETRVVHLFYLCICDNGEVTNSLFSILFTYKMNKTLVISLSSVTPFRTIHHHLLIQPGCLLSFKLFLDVNFPFPKIKMQILPVSLRINYYNKSKLLSTYEVVIVACCYLLWRLLLLTDMRTRPLTTWEISSSTLFLITLPRRSMLPLCWTTFFVCVHYKFSDFSLTWYWIRLVSYKVTGEPALLSETYVGPSCCIYICNDIYQIIIAQVICMIFFYNSSEGKI